MDSEPAAPALSRRRLLAGAALAAGGASLTGTGIVGVATRPSAPGAPAAAPAPREAMEQFYGAHQAGIATPAQAHASFVALDLAAGADRAALGRLLRLLTDDAARLCQGRAPLADTEPDLATAPARLTVTIGFGPGFFAAAGRLDQRPEAIVPLPAFATDRLEQRWSGGDLLVQICADDPLAVSHARRMLIKDARPFGTIRWTQTGFRRAAGVAGPGETQRNVMGQLDGTVNPVPGTPEFDRAVWVDSGPAWWRGGTSLVVRRIRAEMETWDAVDRHAKEFTIGRRLDSGAPLTGRYEHDEPDLTAVDQLGLPVIDTNAHIRRARADRIDLRMLRRPYNYDAAPGPTGVPDAGLIFTAYQADIAAQFTPVQRRLAEADLLNQWITTVGSAVFAIPPGCEPGGWIGETLLE